IENQSVHLSDFPVADDSVVDKELEERMQLAQDISSLVLSIRKKVNIKVRPPLQKILVPVLDKHMEEQIKKVENIVKNEVNVKSFEYLGETEGFIKKKAKPNFKVLGGRMGGKMKAVAAGIFQMGESDISALEKNKTFPLVVDGDTIEIGIGDVDIIAEDI